MVNFRRQREEKSWAVLKPNITGENTQYLSWWCMVCETPWKHNGSVAGFEKDFPVEDPKGNVLAWYDLEFF